MSLDGDKMERLRDGALEDPDFIMSTGNFSDFISPPIRGHRTSMQTNQMTKARQKVKTADSPFR